MPLTALPEQTRRTFGMRSLQDPRIYDAVVRRYRDDIGAGDWPRPGTDSDRVLLVLAVSGDVRFASRRCAQARDWSAPCCRPKSGKEPQPDSPARGDRPKPGSCKRRNQDDNQGKGDGDGRRAQGGHATEPKHRSPGRAQAGPTGQRACGPESGNRALNAGHRAHRANRS